LYAIALVFGNKKDRPKPFEKAIMQVMAESIDFFRGDCREAAAHDGFVLIGGVSVSGKHFIVNATDAEHGPDDPFDGL